jgi:RsiW-degrading membrane proteinase PrsW (M82 family)
MKLLVGIPVVLIATIVLFIYLAFIWWLDRYEREPFWLVGLVFAWGATIGVGCSCGLNSTIMMSVQTALSASSSASIGAILVAPVVEELIKGLVFVPLVLTDHFDNETDGLIYGAAAGLGFASVENLMYFVKFVASPEMGVIAMVAAIGVRTLFTAVMHTISSALLGMTVGYARHRPGETKWLIYPSIGYVLAVGNHALWNTAAVLSNVHAGFQLAGVVLVLLASALLFGITQWSLQREHEAIRTQLHREAERGTLPDEHADIIPYWLKRRKSDWVPPGLDREAYVEAATHLAFRLHQLELADGEDREGYLADIESYRQQVRELLEEARTGA